MLPTAGDLEAPLFWKPTPACVHSWVAPVAGVAAAEAATGTPATAASLTAAVEAVQQVRTKLLQGFSFALVAQCSSQAPERDRAPLLAGLVFSIHGALHGPELAALLARWPELTPPAPVSPLAAVAAVVNPHPPKGKDLADQLTLLEAEWFDGEKRLFAETS